MFINALYQTYCNITSKYSSHYRHVTVDMLLKGSRNIWHQNLPFLGYMTMILRAQNHRVFLVIVQNWVTLNIGHRHNTSKLQLMWLAPI